MMMLLFAFILVTTALVFIALFRVAKIEKNWPPLGRFVDVLGVKAHVVEQGRGPDVLLLHGAASNARELISALGDRLTDVRVIAPDRPGLGYSQRPANSEQLGVQAAFVAGIIEQTNSGPVVAVGHSWGAGVSLRLALDYPHLVRALVLIAPASHPWPKETNILNIMAGWPIIGDLLFWTLPPFVGDLFAPYGIAKGFAPGSVKPENYSDIIGIPLYFRPPSFKANAQDMVAGSAEMGQQAPRYSDIKVPVAIISGQGDRIVSNSLHAKALLAAIPHAETYEVPDAGHMPHWVDPDLAASIIQTFALGTVYPETSAQFAAE